jgi:arylsulfatase B
MRTRLVLTADSNSYGWANVGFHRTDQSREVVTPVIDSLAASGVILDRHYT